MLGLAPEIGRDLARHVNEALPRFAAVGTAHVRGTQLILDGPGGAVSVELGSSAREWPSLSLDERRLLATDLARELVERRRALGAVVRSSAASPVVPIAVLVVTAMLVVGGFAAYPLVFPPASPSSSAAASDPDAERVARSRRVCREARERIARGATVGPADVEGWVVELMLLRTISDVALVHDPGLTAFLDRAEPGVPTHLVWSGAATLAALERPTAAVVLAGSNLPEATPPRWHVATLTFSGRFVDYYFRSTERGSFFALAAALTERLGATYAGLYARCEEGSAHAVGTWFRGPDPASTAAALVYFMGTFGEVSHVAAEHLSLGGGTLDPTRVLVDLPPLGRDLDRSRLATLLADSGGMVAGRPGSPLTITFPFERSNRATRASVHLARHFGVAPPL